MRVFAIEHDGIWLGGYSIVVAEDQEEAEGMMRKALAEMKLKDTIYKTTEIATNEKKVHVLWDGDY